MAWALGGAFATGFAAGWVVRSFTSSTRGALVGVVAVAHGAYHDMSRIIGQTAEWAEDIIAEGKAQYERAASRGAPEPPPTQPPPTQPPPTEG